jgi:hypothetical protein
MHPPRRVFAFLVLGGLSLPLTDVPARAANFEVQPQDDKVTVKLDGQLFTEYLTRSGAKPVLWPVIGPTGKAVTRRYPMQSAGPDEKQDHVHHRSFWFTHGEVNDTDFWLEGRPSGGTIVHREFLELDGGETGVIATRNDWVDRHGKTICQDERTLTFGTWEQSRYIDFDITIQATDGPVTFGDTKEGTFGVRVAGTMKVEAEMGGQIVNSRGQQNKEAWGQQAPWVDYHGPVDGQRVGIAILNHPRSFRFPTYWHVRTYGLFAANPFGWHDFQKDDSVDGSYVLQPGDSMTFHYRVLIHRGNHLEGRVAEAFQEYSRSEK